MTFKLFAPYKDYDKVPQAIYCQPIQWEKIMKLNIVIWLYSLNKSSANPDTGSDTASSKEVCEALVKALGTTTVKRQKCSIGLNTDWACGIFDDRQLTPC